MARAFLEPYENMFIELNLENYPHSDRIEVERKEPS